MYALYEPIRFFFNGFFCTPERKDVIKQICGVFSMHTRDGSQSLMEETQAIFSKLDKA